MAKRKRSTNIATGSRKKSKVPHAHGDVDPDHFYKLKSIVGESTTKYLISWEDDEVTGEKFEDTWEPKANANSQAILDWEQQKAEKKRIKELSGANNDSPSSSASSTSQPPDPSRAVGRRRRVIESSPQPGADPLSNGHPVEGIVEEDDPIEIGESDEEAGIGSPLFQPQRPTVHPSPPPSSYLAGGYQAISSTQAASSAAPSPTKPSPEPSQTRNSPEPSQYLPDQADTSKTTDDTTDFSLAPTTPSAQQPQPTQADLPSSSINVVPDSQGVPGSSSYVPSAPGTVLSSSSLEQGQGESSLEADTSELLQEEHAVSSTAAPREAQEDILTAAPSGNSAGDGFVPVSAERSLGVEAVETAEHVESSYAAQLAEGLETAEVSESPAPVGTAAAVTNATAAEAAESVEPAQAVENSENVSATPAAPIEIETPPVSAKGTGSTQQVLEAEPSVNGVEDLDRAFGVVEGQSTPNQASSPPPAPQEGSAGVSPIEESAQHSASRSNQQLTKTPEQGVHARGFSVENHTSSLEARSTNPGVLDDTGAGTARPAAFTNIRDSHSGSSDRRSENEERARHTRASQNADFAAFPTVSGSPQPGYIDLTHTQEHTNSIQSFAVTSPVQRPIDAFGVAGRRTSPRPPSSSSVWPSPFLFQTQPAHLASTQTYWNAISPGAVFQSQPLPQSHISLPEEAGFSPNVSNIPQSQPSPLLTSSSILRPPSQSIDIGTLGESAPPLPAVLSSPYRSPTITRMMDTSEYKTEIAESLSAKLAAMRERNRAKFSGPSQSTTSLHQEATSQNTSPAQRALHPKLASPFLLAHDRARSPSAVPAMEPLTAITRDEMNTSRRVPTLLPQSHENASNEANESGASTNSASQKQTTPDRDPELADVHALPVYFLGHQRDQYPQMVHFHEDLILRFLGPKNPDEALLADAKRFLDRIRRITIHPDLDDIDTFTQYDVQPSQQVKWHSSFAKFHFLKDLLDSLRDSKLHIAILAEGSHTFDILENFLQGLDVPHRRYKAHGAGVLDGLPTISDGLRVSLLESEIASTHTDNDPIDLIIAMDNSVKRETISNLQRMGDKWIPSITLVVPYTVEHIERCLAPTLPDLARQRALTSGVYKYRLQAGRPSPGEQVPKDTAKKLAEYLTTSPGDRTEWPLLGLANLEDLDSQTESEVTVSNENSKLALGEKRLRESDDLEVEDSHKRSRVESPVGGLPDIPPIANLPEIDVIYVSDSIKKGTQDAEVDSSELTSTERRLQDLVQQAQDDRDEHRRDLSDLQYRFEEQRTELIQRTTERDAAIDTAQNAINRYTAEATQTSNLRAELSTTKEQLGEANKRLLDHSVPERAEIEALRLEVAQAKADKEKAERRQEQAAKDAAYMRDLYQNASSSAQTLAAQNSDLENQLAVAQNRAAGEQAKLRQMSHDNFTKNLQTENRKLKVLLKEREAGLKFKDEEIAKLKEANRGRMGTRGTSVPRSPRMGSRQTSPAAGELRGRAGLLHPLRNAEV